MTKEEFELFVEKNKAELPLFFQTFEFKKRNEASNYKVLSKFVNSPFHNTDKYPVQKFHKNIVSF